MEQASGSIMAGISVFSVRLSLTQLWPSTIAFQVNTGVSYCLDYVQDIYDPMY